MEKYPGEASRVARDLNIDTATLQKVADQGDGPSALLNRRLRLLLGFDLGQLRIREPAIAQDLARCCALCRSKSQCARDLARNPGGGNWRTYCPNEATIEMLRPGLAGMAAALEY
jgi:hypothetical protein